MTRGYCPPVSKMPYGWLQDRKGRWACPACGRTRLRIRTRHKSTSKPSRPISDFKRLPHIEIPGWGDRNGSRKEIVGYAWISPQDRHLARYKYRVNTGGYWYRQSWVHRKSKGKRVRYNIFLHREVMGMAEDDPLEIHHIDDHPWNCQRGNLEKVTRSQNEQYKVKVGRPLPPKKA